MTSSFGARLRQHREERGVALSLVAAQTKIKVSLLEGLERDDLAHWPPGIFRRAYLRAYAHAIGLDPDTIVREFLERYPDPLESAEPAKPSESNAASTGAPMRLRHIVGSAVGSLARLRRGPVVDNRVRPQGTTGNIPAPVSTPAAVDVPPPFDEPVPFEMPPVAAVEPPLVAIDAPPPPPESASPASERATAPDPLPVQAESRAEVDLLGAAHLCTALGRVENVGQMPALLRETARILEARGLIVWVWDGLAEELQPALVHGYSEKVLAHLPSLKADADNLTAAAFRAGQTLGMNGDAGTSGALAVPLLTPGGCAGVLAIELEGTGAESASVRAVGMFIAAMLAQLVGGAPAGAESAHDPEAERHSTQISNAG